ncbi:M23 family metallopeptidase [Streptomyces poriticola]|uniref:M23 family metallopeptidase n=1 Tax=Streptomyces poriticola TaxID=3120506 RepID=UPI002FCE398B
MQSNSPRLQETDTDGRPGPTSLTTLGLLTGLFRATGKPPAKGRVPSAAPDHKVTFGFFERGPHAWRPDGVGRHTGQDLAAPSGVPVVAVRGGKVARPNGKAGAYGQWIGLAAGQQLGKVGNTGNPTGPHLHFAMSKGSSCSYGNVAKPTW